MSMEVDHSTPLTRAERKYLLDRGSEDLVRSLDERHGTSGDDADLWDGDGTGTQFESVNQGERAADRKRVLLAELAAIEAAENPAGDEGDGDEDADQNLAPYSEWTVKELDAELSTRNLPGGGKQADKVKRLEEDDAANA